MIDATPLAPFCIVPAARPGLNAAQNKVRHDTLEGLLEVAEIPHKPVQGSYQGQLEDSFVVLTTPVAALAIAQRFGQESILCVDGDRQAVLHYTGLNPDAEPYAPQPIGRWRAIPKVLALQKSAWTYDESTDTYYVAD
jgi:hypothetical protein